MSAGSLPPRGSRGSLEWKVVLDAEPVVAPQEVRNPLPKATRNANACLGRISLFISPFEFFRAVESSLNPTVDRVKHHCGRRVDSPLSSVECQSASASLVAPSIVRGPPSWVVKQLQRCRGT